MNKALVSVGQRPIIAHQLEAFRLAGIRNVLVITSPDSQSQVMNVIERSHSGLGMVVQYATQHHAHGPGHAVKIAVDHLPVDCSDVVIAMADTFFGTYDLDISESDWIGVSPAPSTRHWCYLDWGTNVWAEGEVNAGGTPVAIGLYYFADVRKLQRATKATCTHTQAGAEIQMAPLLNAYGDLTPLIVHSWRDVGDVPALIRTRRSRFLSRSFNHLELDDYGRVTKHGSGEAFADEMVMMWEAPGERSLWPMMYELGQKHAVMEFIDLPTLAELYLFWPGRPDMWAYIIKDLVCRMETLWQVPPDISTGIERRCHNMYITKMEQRFKDWEHPIKKHDCLLVNGRSVGAGPNMLALLSEYLEQDVIPHYRRGTIHGDLNMSNVLYSLGTGTFKLVDPRGRWGGTGPEGDVRYEIAKLRYSYADHFCSITHGLCDWNADEEEVYIRFGPDRAAETEAIDQALFEHTWDLDAVKAIEASIFLSAMPLHPEQEAVPLYVQGCMLADEVLW